MKTFSMIAGAAFLAVAGVAVAQPASAPRADRDADISRQQLVERIDARFARLDLDADGRATREEGRAAAQQRREQRAGRAFARFDLDGDGSITRAEFDQARAQRAERRQMRGDRAGRRGMRGMRAARLFGEQGFVTREQLRERALARFDRLDANRDGVMTTAERRQGRHHRMEERRNRSN